MRSATVVRLALAGSRTDTLRVVFTAVGAALAAIAVLATGTVLSIPSGVHIAADGTYTVVERYTNILLTQPGLRAGVSMALVLLTIPVLFFAAQCTRIGAPARDRRLAAFRMAGATPAQVRLIAAVETGAAVLCGAAVGIVAFLGVRVLLDDPGPDGRRPLPTDVLPPEWLFAAVGAGLPVVATLVALWLLRRVALTPFGVVRRRRVRPPRAWSGVLLVMGLVGLWAFAPLERYVVGTLQEPPWWDSALLAWVSGSALLLALGLVFGIAWLGHRTARMLHRFSGRPSILIATRRLDADPWSGSRLLAVITFAALFGGGAAMVRALVAAQFEAADQLERRLAAFYREPAPESRDVDFYFQTFDLVDTAVLVAVVIAAASLTVAVIEGIVARRRTLSSLVAGGTPRRVLAGATLLEVLIPLVPATTVAAGSGALAMWLFGRRRAEPQVIVTEVTPDTVCRPAPGDTREACQDSAYAAAHQVPRPDFYTFDPHVPWQDLAVVGGGTVALVVAMTAVSFLFLRPSTDVSELRTT